MQAGVSCVPLPELTVTDSSEALLTGRKPPFRMVALPLACAAPGSGAGEGMPLAGWCYAVSEEFVVSGEGGGALR